MLINPLVLNIASTTIDHKRRRCWCWLFVAVICAVFAYLAYRCHAI